MAEILANRKARADFTAFDKIMKRRGAHLLKLVHDHAHPAELEFGNTAAKKAAIAGDAQSFAELLSSLDPDSDEQE